MTLYIVTPTWNCGAEFARCAASVARRTRIGGIRGSVRWVIVENGSEESERVPVREAIGEYLTGAVAIRLEAYITNGENLGIPVAQNQALDWIEAQGREPYGVVFLSADTEIKRAGWLEGLLDYVAGHPKAGIVGGARSPQGESLPVFHGHNGRWYQHTRVPEGFREGETVDFSMAYVRPEVMARGVRFDVGYEIYDGYDQDLCFRVRSWGYQVHQVDVGVVHYGSAAMKKAGYRWKGGGRAEWDALRARNLERFVAIWGDWLRSRRKSIAGEREHLRVMNRRLVAEAGYRKYVPESYAYLTTEGAALTIREREWLRRVAAETRGKRGAQQVIVNIGVYKGASLHCLRAGSPWARLIGVDIERPRSGDLPEAELWIGDSGELHRRLSGVVHLLFVDGDHSREAVEADFGWVEKVAVDGIVAFHDYRPAAEHLAARPHIDGVRQVVDERLAGNPTWREVPAADSIKAFIRVNR